MGKYLSKWKQQPSTVEVLEQLNKDISSLERSRQTNVERQKRIITYLILYSVGVYIVVALLFFFFYLPKDWLHRILYSLPLLIFPLIVWLVKQFLHWYFVKRIRRNEEALESLKEKKKQILDDVMETETYKKAREILEKFAPDRIAVKTDIKPSPPASPKTTADQGEGLRHRIKQQQQLQNQQLHMQQQHMQQQHMQQQQQHMQQQQQHMQQQQQQGASPPAGLQSPVVAQTPMKNRQQFQSNPAFCTPAPPGFVPVCPPSTARPVLKRDRTLMDRVVDYLLGDGPQNRYALICKDCYSHNGMALREEFEYLSFRCSYCFSENPARKYKPKAPPLETTQPINDRSGNVTAETPSDLGVDGRDITTATKSEESHDMSAQVDSPVEDSSEMDTTECPTDATKINS